MEKVRDEEEARVAVVHLIMGELLGEPRMVRCG